MTSDATPKTIETPTAYLRWRAGVLEQLWVVVKHIHKRGFVTPLPITTEEWRAVPHDE